MKEKAVKLVTLNIWGGHVEKPLFNFIEANQNIEIFCFQEVYHNASEKISGDDRKVNLTIFSELQELLPHHQAFFRPVVNNIYGIGMFIANNIDVLNEGEISIYENHHYSGRGPAHSRNLQWAQCSINNQFYSVMNVHGLWNGLGKTDTPERIAQATRIRNFMDTLNTPKILCGDLNLRPDTESIKILEHGMNNQIKIHDIKSTRTTLYPKSERFADYIFTSPEISVKNFKVLQDEVSDHAPLFLEFDLMES